MLRNLAGARSRNPESKAEGPGKRKLAEAAGVELEAFSRRERSGSLLPKS